MKSGRFSVFRTIIFGFFLPVDVKGLLVKLLHKLSSANLTDSAHHLHHLLH